jgi:hypothetical protein
MHHLRKSKKLINTQKLSWLTLPNEIQKKAVDMLRATGVILERLSKIQIHSERTSLRPAALPVEMKIGFLGNHDIYQSLKTIKRFFSSVDLLFGNVTRQIINAG